MDLLVVLLLQVLALLGMYRLHIGLHLPGSSRLGRIRRCSSLGRGVRRRAGLDAGTVLLDEHRTGRPLVAVVGLALCVDRLVDIGLGGRDHQGKRGQGNR